MSKAVKKQMVKELTSRYRGANNWVIINYKGLKSQGSTSFRNFLRASNIKVNVLKNAVLRFTFDELGWSEGTKIMEGPTAIIYSEKKSKADDPITLAKSIYGWREKNPDAAKLVVIRGGYSEGRFVSAGDITEFSRLPSREILLSQLAGGLKAPLTKLAYALNALPQKLALLVNALNQKTENKEQKTEDKK